MADPERFQVQCPPCGLVASGLGSLEEAVAAAMAHGDHHATVVSFVATCPTCGVLGNFPEEMAANSEASTHVLAHMAVPLAEG